MLSGPPHAGGTPCFRLDEKLHVVTGSSGLDQRVFATANFNK